MATTIEAAITARATMTSPRFIGLLRSTTASSFRQLGAILEGWSAAISPFRTRHPDGDAVIECVTVDTLQNPTSTEHAMTTRARPRRDRRVPADCRERAPRARRPTTA